MDLDKLKKKVNDLKYLNDRKMLSAPDDTLLGDWLDFWLETYKKSQVKPLPMICITALLSDISSRSWGITKLINSIKLSYRSL